MPNQVFKDVLLEKEFNQKGYAKIPFLNSEEIEHLKKMFFETIAESGGPKTSGDVDFDTNSLITYDFTFIDKNTDYKRKVFKIITEAFQNKTENYLNNYRPIIANFIRKQKDGGEVPMHQNWAFVDEMKYTSVSVWVPLVDSNEENGTLQMVDGSHKRFGRYRGPMVPWELRHLKEEIVAKHLTPMNVKAGECVVLDDSIVHYSNVNKTPGLRLAIQLILVPKEAPTIHYHLDREENKHRIHVLETDDDFYMNFHPWLKPVGKRELASVFFKEEDFTYNDFLKGLVAPRFDEIKPSKKIQALFKDAETQARFETDGFVKVNFLNDEEVTDLKHYYLSLNHDHIGEYGFHISLENKNESYVNGVFKKLFHTFSPKLDGLLRDYKTFTASYVIKEAGLQNIVPPHQDWSFVDEEEFCSATVWVPLQDVNKNNGALGVIKGSHKLFSYQRQSPSPQAKTVLSPHAFTLFPFVEVIEMKAGEALIFDNRTIHASPPNISGKTRIAAGIGITQKQAQLLHFYQAPGKEEQINVYEVEESFFPKYNNSIMSSLYNNGESPTELKLIRSFKKQTPIMSDEEMRALVMTLPDVKFNSELMHELANLYNYNMDGSPKTKAPAKQETKAEPVAKELLVAETNFVQKPNYDERSFFEKYTPSNILAEIKYRLTKNSN
ncbi:MAG: phytanoyl-CoA dioxygenase family protein [Bacteroidia bacterium]|nr:phytanoyl-CoA dioxygenase family protein [Bacteroidia bacterium]